MSWLALSGAECASKKVLVWSCLPLSTLFIRALEPTRHWIPTPASLISLFLGHSSIIQMAMKDWSRSQCFRDVQSFMEPRPLEKHGLVNCSGPLLGLAFEPKRSFQDCLCPWMLPLPSNFAHLYKPQRKNTQILKYCTRCVLAGTLLGSRCSHRIQSHHTLFELYWSLLRLQKYSTSTCFRCRLCSSLHHAAFCVRSWYVFSSFLVFTILAAVRLELGAAAPFQFLFKLRLCKGGGSWRSRIANIHSKLNFPLQPWVLDMIWWYATCIYMFCRSWKITEMDQALWLRPSCKKATAKIPSNTPQLSNHGSSFQDFRSSSALPLSHECDRF